MSVTATRPDQYETGESRNGGQSSRSEAVTATRTDQYGSGQRAVTCHKCGEPVPFDHNVLVEGSEHATRYTCIPCAKQRKYWRWPWARSGRPMAEYHHRCTRCRRPFYGALKRRYCSHDCGELERRSRRDRTVDRVQHRCECGVTFTARADARYHSNACRQRAYRQRGGE